MESYEEASDKFSSEYPNNCKLYQNYVLILFIADNAILKSTMDKIYMEVPINFDQKVLILNGK